MTLRDVSEDDLLVFFEHQREPEANFMAAFPARDLAAFMDHWRVKVLGNSSVQKKTVVLDNEVAGNIESWEQDGRRLLGYWIGKNYWGRGIATAAVQEFLAQFEKTRPLYAYVASRNVGSIRVLEKCGFLRFGNTVKGHDGVEEYLMQLKS